MQKFLLKNKKLSRIIAALNCMMVISVFSIVSGCSKVSDEKIEVFKATKATAYTYREKKTDFSLLDLSGEKVNLFDFRGKIVIIQFWAMWCSICVEAIPELNELYDKYKPKGVELLSISIDSGGGHAVRSFVKKTGIKYPVLLVDDKIKKVYKIVGVPSIFIIDPQGNIYKKYVGYRPKEVLEKDIESLLEKGAQDETRGR